MKRLHIKLFFYHHSERGAGLLVALMAIVVLGLIVGVFMTQSENSLHRSFSLAHHVEKEVLAEYFSQATDCYKTFEVIKSCPKGNLSKRAVDLIQTSSATDNQYIARRNQYTRYGRWAVKAFCNDTGDGINIVATRLRKNRNFTSTKDADYFPDPVTKRRVKFGDEAAFLYNESNELCRYKRFYKDLSVWNKKHFATTKQKGGTLFVPPNSSKPIPLSADLDLMGLTKGDCIVAQCDGKIRINYQAVATPHDTDLPLNTKGGHLKLKWRQGSNQGIKTFGTTDSRVKNHPSSIDVSYPTTVKKGAEFCLEFENLNTTSTFRIEETSLVVWDIETEKC